MSFDFIFEDEAETKRGQLLQGDVLFRDAALATSIGEAHQYYANAPDYTHFMVLTQSCDLARRGKARPKARYISICAVRPVHIIVDRLLARFRITQPDDDSLGFPVPVCSKNNEVLVRQTLERLLHNTEEGFFFIPRDSHKAITEDLCAFLPLSIALRSDHYDVVLRSKIAQLRPVFQAKVGWLAGTQYSRVATPDVEERVADPERVKNEYYDSLLYKRSIWLTSPQYRELKKKVVDWRRANPDQTLDPETAAGLVESLAKPTESVADRVISLLKENGLLAAAADVGRAKTLLASDTVLERLIRGL